MDLYVSRLEADTALPGKLQGQNEKYVSYICRKHFLSPCFDQAVGLPCSLATTAFSPCLHRAVRAPCQAQWHFPSPGQLLPFSRSHCSGLTRKASVISAGAPPAPGSYLIGFFPPYFSQKTHTQANGNTHGVAAPLAKHQGS